MNGLFFNLSIFKVIEVFVGANFAASWAAENSLDPNIVLSRTGSFVFLFSWPLFWQSKLHVEIVLSTAEAEHIVLSYFLRNTTALLNLVNELAEALDFLLDAPKAKHTLFEDNQSTMLVAKSPTMLHRMKNTSVKHHRFRKHA